METITKLTKIVNEIKELDLLEDRKEYGVEDLMHCYKLDEQEAKALDLLLQAE